MKFLLSLILWLLGLFICKLIGINWLFNLILWGSISIFVIAFILGVIATIFPDN